MNSTSKGNRLEDDFHRFLLDQQSRGELVFETYPPTNCKIFKKKKYFCKERDDDVEFDVVVEVYRQGGLEPHLSVVFECKNYSGNVPETAVNDFSAKIGRIFKHAHKGIIVVSSQLQSGADKVARSSKMGIVKYDENGLDIIAERRGGLSLENNFVESQIFRNEHPGKSLKFSGYHDGCFFGSIAQFLRSLDPELSVGSGSANHTAPTAVRYVPVYDIKKSARAILEQIGYQGGRVDLQQICDELSIDLQFTNHLVKDADGNLILGSANFTRRLIQINAHEDGNRERFTIGHEIGHFCLKHDGYLRSENVIESDLLIHSQSKKSLNYERLEFQANAFSSELILPDRPFSIKTAEYRRDLDIRDRGHGYIFVDDQPWNYQAYNELLSRLSSHFEVSKQAIEIKFKNMGWLNDQRKKYEASSAFGALENLTSFRR
ncbi:ImmA/IrrE family metallo-endopeptidase [Rhizobium herbae]|uniref:ImmA/IrrE family metallo-endopeptidase n=1 Tax=Rhizobium herbae TaxID=508661 RepID=A0ABS7H9Y9_9HYPH|nr:ImmA/IrrE family metallo-endopeptidase [Rhizobium herbae]